MDDVGYLIAILRFPPLGPIRCARLRAAFSHWKEVFIASDEALMNAGIEPNIAREFVKMRASLDPERECSLLTSHNVQAIPWEDPRYPALLKTIHDPPPILFVRGCLPSPDLPRLAVVGTRKPTPYGQRAVRIIVEPLARQGMVIVSGLAYGIDAFAHEAACQAGGKTLAVLGSGVDAPSVYPAGHQALSERILASGGAILSEFPIGTPALKFHFPFRNRVIAGLCQGTLVIEAGVTSGALITSHAALDDGREVFAVPGPFDALFSAGPNNLIKMGAHVATQPDDILSIFRMEPTVCASALPIQTKKCSEPDPNLPPASPTETIILQHLSTEPIHADDLARELHLPIPTVTSALLLMEMKGSARQVGGMYYVKG